jgi:hypothetical protein
VRGLEKSESLSGTLFTNISFIYKRNVLFIKSQSMNPGRFVRLHLNVGINYCYKPDNGLEEMDSDRGQYMAPDSSIYEVIGTSYNVPVKGFSMLKAMVGFDITFGKNSTEWFTLCGSLVHGGSRYFSYTTIQVNHYVNYEKQAYFTHVIGTGNGIYLSISRRIFLRRKPAKEPAKMERPGE